MSLFECCKDCEFRHYLCHADCPEKAKADAKNEALKKAKRETVPIKAYSREKKTKVDRKRRHHQKT